MQFWTALGKGAEDAQGRVLLVRSRIAKALAAELTEEEAALLRQDISAAREAANAVILLRRAAARQLRERRVGRRWAGSMGGGARLPPVAAPRAQAG